WTSSKSGRSERVDPDQPEKRRNAAATPDMYAVSRFREKWGQVHFLERPDCDSHRAAGNVRSILDRASREASYAGLRPRLGPSMPQTSESRRMRAMKRSPR